MGYLYARWYVVYYTNSFAVRVSRKWVRNDMVFHLPRWLIARLHTIDCFACGTLQAAIFVSIVVHSYQALQMVLMATLCQPTDWFRTGHSTHTWTFITRGASQRFHTDSAVLKGISEDIYFFRKCIYKRFYTLLTWKVNCSVYTLQIVWYQIGEIKKLNLINSASSTICCKVYAIFRCIC